MVDDEAREGGRLTRPGEAGQATTEFLMISGLMTAVAIMVLNVMEVPFREFFEYLINLVADPPA